ncbi:MAG TPA: heavy metal translocating P-type ATPase [Rhodocyclaceae bacterium]|nr:heavy metal translocating P-type ATPase [Rhodocyclaceae bacterium]
MHMELPIVGMSCAACANRIEAVLNRLPGVRAQVNFASERAYLETSGATPAEELVAAVRRAGYDVASRSAELALVGMSCAACATRIETVLQRLPGIEAHVNFANERAYLRLTPGVGTVEAAIEAVRSAGYDAHLIEGSSPAALRAQALGRWRQERQRCLLAALLTIPLIAQMPFMFIGDSTHTGHDLLPRWLQLVLAAPVQFWAGARFYHGAWRALRGGSANMDVLVALGTTLAWGYSAVVTVFAMPHHHVYFEGSAAVITLVLLGKLLESKAKARAADAIETLLALQPQTARIDRDGQIVTVPADSLLPGDVYIVPAGEAIPVDGEVIEGMSAVDEALLTGESFPVSKRPGMPVYAGTRNGNGTLRARATGVGSATLLAGIVRLVEQAQGSRAPIQRLADRVSAVFVPTVLAIAALTFVGWLGIDGRLGPALVNAVSVLVIACPCALGLATPAAIMVGSGRGAGAGILIKNAAALEHAGALKILVTDKTGTLTAGHPAVEQIHTLAEGVTPNDQIRYAASLEQGSEHPLARAMLDAARSAGLVLSVPEDMQTLPGQGLSGRVGGARVHVGSPAYMAALGKSIPDQMLTDFAGQGASLVAVANDERLLGVIAVADPLRAGSAAAIAKLRALGIEIVLLTGDHAATARAVADTLGIDRWRAQVMPADKAREVSRLKQAGTVIGMVGDGINDAPALASADVSFAIGAGSRAALDAADIALMSDDLGGVVNAVSLSRATVRTIRQNLFFAFFYNVLGIPLAALGLMNPVFAGAAMAMSSVSVMANALRLRGWRPDARALN